MKNKFIIASIIFLISIIYSFQVSAFFPLSHKYIGEQSMIQPIDSEFYQACVKYPELCYVGEVETDVTVVFYYTAGILYSTDHQPPFCASMLNNIAKIPGSDPEKLRACAVGACIHQAQDLPSHSDNGLVQYVIKHSFLANSIIHTFAEQKVDSYIERNNPTIKGESDQELLESYRICEPLFITTLLGESSYQSSGLTKETLEGIFDDFINEVVSSTKTGYNPSFEHKSFIGTLDSIPFTILGIYIAIMLILLLINILLLIKTIRRKSKIRHYIGIVIFLPLFIIFLILFIGAVQGNVFKTFISLIKPVAELVPINNPETYLNMGISNTQQLLIHGETFLEGTDASGRGTNPVLDVADSQVMYVDYIIFGLLAFGLILFIWFLFKKDKIKSEDIFSI